MDYIALFLTLFGVPVLLSLPTVLQARSVWSFVVETLRWLTFIWVPLLVFFASAGMAPEWKGQSGWGPVGSWIATKIWLTPMVLWACAALYAGGLGFRPRGWAPGLVSGAVAATLCAVYGVVVMLPNVGTALVMLLVPLYTAAVYTFHAARAVRAVGLSRGDIAAVGFVGVPSLVASAIHAQQEYASLPDEPPDCFVVTAASHGDPAEVGPFFLVTRNGRQRRANRQLLTFWAFEARWSARSPASHDVFRRVYAWVGPVVARHTAGTMRATLVFRSLRPLEALAARLFV